MKLKKDLNLSNLIKTSTDKEILLLNNEYTKETKLIIISDNTIKNKKQFKSMDLNNLSLNDSNLFIDCLKNYCNDKTEAYYILSELIETLNNNKENGYYETNNNNIISLYDDNIKIIEDKKHNDKINYNNKQIELLRTDIIIILENIMGHDENGEPLNPKRLGKADLPKCLAKYLSVKYGLILRSNVNTPHLLNKDNNCYELTNNEYLLSLIANDFGHNNISMTDTKKALDYIDIRLKPNYHIIRFDNCIYDMKTHKVIKLTSPQLPYYDIYFNYNQKAKGELIQQFLYSSLNENQVQGLLELIGYLFTVGNKENIIICFIGKGGGGKSVLSNIISHLFKRVSNLPIHNLNKNHDLMSLENSLLNICNDTDNSTIKDNGTFKQITGGDSLYINPKYREPYVMPPFEVPYFIMVGNQFPKFERLEIPIIERLMIIEFKKGFRGTKDQRKNLFDDIINDDDNIEWLIYHSLQSYKNIDINNKSFTLKKTTKENRDLYNKHTNPLLWIIKKLIVFVDYDNFISEIKDNNLSNYMASYISVDELKQNILTYANNEGLDIGLTDNNNISTQKLTNTIKTAFNLWSLNDIINYDYSPIKKQENNNRFLVYPNIEFKE